MRRCLGTSPSTSLMQGYIPFSMSLYTVLLVSLLLLWPFSPSGYYSLAVLKQASYKPLYERIWLTPRDVPGRVLFRNLLTSLSAATFRFYDTTPTGRILNRFGKDFDSLDGMLAFLLLHTSSVATFLAAVITVAPIIPWLIPVAVLFSVSHHIMLELVVSVLDTHHSFSKHLYTRLSLGYLSTSLNLRRMESTTRSPILAGLMSLIDIITLVRAFSAEKQFLHYKRVDTSNKFWYFT